MPFKPAVKKKIVRDLKTDEHLPCVMCGTRYPLPDAIHIIDEKEWRKKVDRDLKVNGIPLCPNCHRIFDEVLRPYLYRALTKFGAKDLPEGWSKSNKLSVSEAELNLPAPSRRSR
jgi:predicted restriction endonuclease